VAEVRHPAPPPKAESPPTGAEMRLLGHIREIGYGEVLIKVESGQPTRILRSTENILIPQN